MNSVCACGSWICSSKKCEKEASELGDELGDDDFDEDLEDELNEPEDADVRKSGKFEDIEDKIFKIEEVRVVFCEAATCDADFNLFEHF